MLARLDKPLLRPRMRNTDAGLRVSDGPTQGTKRARDVFQMIHEDELAGDYYDARNNPQRNVAIIRAKPGSAAAERASKALDKHHPGLLPDAVRLQHELAVASKTPLPKAKTVPLTPKKVPRFIGPIPRSPAAQNARKRLFVDDGVLDPADDDGPGLALEEDRTTRTKVPKRVLDQMQPRGHFILKDIRKVGSDAYKDLKDTVNFRLQKSARDSSKFVVDSAKAALDGTAHILGKSSKRKFEELTDKARTALFKKYDNIGQLFGGSRSTVKPSSKRPSAKKVARVKKAATKYPFKLF